MAPGLRATALAALAALAFLPVPPSGAADGDLPPLDYQAYWASVPETRALSKAGLDAVSKLHDLMTALVDSEKDEKKSHAIRADVKGLLEDYRAGKVRMIALVDKALKTPAPTMTDLQILQKLRDTDLLDLHWREAYFKNCIRDVSERLRIPMVLSPKVVQLNTVSADFDRSSAAGVLRWLCEGFDLQYLVHNGQVLLTKKLDRSDERFQDYLKKHPDWKYWLPEPLPKAEEQE